MQFIRRVQRTENAPIHVTVYIKITMAKALTLRVTCGSSWAVVKSLLKLTVVLILGLLPLSLLLKGK